MPLVTIVSVPQHDTIQPLNILDSGYLKPISSNMFEAKGPSHENGGMTVSADGSSFKPAANIEGGEAVFKGLDGSTVIGGNLKVPGMGTTFKTEFRKIGEQQAKYEKKFEKAATLMQDNDPENKFSQLSYNAGKVMAMSSQNQHRQLEGKKQGLAELQQGIHDMANTLNMEPKDVAKGMKRFGGKLSSPLTGIPKGKGGLSLAQRNNNPGNLKFAPWMKQFGATPGQPGTDGGNFAVFPDLQSGQEAMKNLLFNKYDKNTTVDRAISKWTNNAPYPTELWGNLSGRTLGSLTPGERSQLLNAFTVGEDGKKYNWKGMPEFTASQEVPQSRTPDYLEPLSPVQSRPASLPEYVPIGLTPDQNTYLNVAKANVTSAQSSIQDKERKAASAARFNKLGIRDILPELMALGDRPDFVPVNHYKPLLQNPYSVSFQDRRNEANAAFRSIQNNLAGNPEALSVQAGQLYGNLNQIGAEEFRTNQQIANGIYNANQQTLNQAALQNLQLDDQQMVRQTQARENTRANQRSALNSISDKFAKNRKDNADIRLYENMFGFRPSGPDMNMGYYGPNAYFGYGYLPGQQAYNPNAEVTTKELTDPETGEVTKTVITKTKPKKRFGGKLKTTSRPTLR